MYISLDENIGIDTDESTISTSKSFAIMSCKCLSLISDAHKVELVCNWVQVQIS